ncbi:MAG: hypothetical protein HZA66_20555 [Rhodopseudomonas palustris]|uniref:SPOR domain-containing protein n=1 Tax=Rhodopseudomonas palustris TaxID=1076 RepID=A0A933VW89_RHOPL|nr:hypothetical protein [Rhodopseudomonas palustris]
MARNSDDLADSFATDESGGWLTRFLADEEELDTRGKWRLASWAAGSLGALLIAILASQTAVDRRRDQVAAADLARQSQQIQRLAKESQGEASRLAAAIDTLNSDRDRLYSRLGSLEQGLESVTGSIARVTASAKPTAGTDKAAALPDIPVKEHAHPAPPIAAVESKASAPATAAVPAAQPMPSTAKSSAPVAATEPALPPAAPEPAATVLAAAPAAAASPSATPAPAMPASPPATAAAETKRPDKPALAAVQPATPLMPSRSMLAPPDSAAGRLVQPQASTPPAPEGEPDVDTPEETAVVVPRAEFGVELGGANSVDGLRGLWRRLSKAHKELKDMRPIIMVKENASGGQLRLVAGPLNDAAAAAKLCAVLGAADRTCETSAFDGQRLPLTSTAPPPRAPRKRPPKVTAAPEPPPPPEPPPAPKPAASLSSILGLR